MMAWADSVVGVRGKGGVAVTSSEDWPRVAVAGAGAVGGYFGGMLAAAGAPVLMIGRRPFVEAVSRQGLILERASFRKSVRVGATTEASGVRRADLVLFSVKTTASALMARALAPFLAPGAIVVSLQNGVDNAAEIREAAGIEALPAAVYVAASMPEPGRVKHAGRGDLILGPPGEKAKRAAETFLRAGVPCRISDNIEGELWKKLIWNCALNAVSALGQARYAEIASNPEACQLMGAIVEEVLAVARAAGIVLPGINDPQAALAGALEIAAAMPAALSSTGQDISRGRPTEIDSLNGYITRRGAELGIATPVNHALLALVKLREAGLGSG